MKWHVAVIAAVLILAAGMMPVETSALEVYLPHITGGDTVWSDVLQVDNNSATSQTFTLTLYAAGSQVYQETYAISGLSELLITVKDLSFGAQTGLITYSSDQLNFRLGYQASSGGGVAEFRLTDELHPILGFYFSDHIPAISWKGIAMANFGSAAATVRLYAVGGGQVLDNTTVTIAPDTKEVGYYTKWFPSVDFLDIKKIIAVCSGNLSGITISGDAVSSLLLFTPAAALSDFSAGTIVSTDITGTWHGSWYSTDYLGESGGAVMEIVQSGSTFAGTAAFTNTDCGDVSGVPISGTVSGTTVTINGSYNCQGNQATLSYTSAAVVSNTMAGTYQQNVNGQLYDRGTFSLTKQ